MLRSIGAVLAGWGVVGILVILTDAVLMKLFPHDYVAGQMPPDRLALVSLATGTLYSVAGGWVTARIAAYKPWTHAVALALWGETLGLISTMMTLGQIQLWYQVGLLVLWAPAVALGCWLRAGKPNFSKTGEA